ncbi:MAG: tetratricopeptide repeat protein [Bdellovibrionota bacterium]
MPKFILIFFLIFGFFSQYSAVKAEGDISLSREDGIEAYDAGKYQEAVNQYKSLIRQYPGNGHLYYNLGNAFFRVDHRGESIAAYMKARDLLPRDPDIRKNLSFVVSQNKDKLSPDMPKSLLMSLAFWSDFVTLKELAYACALSFAIAFFLFVFVLLKPKFEMVRFLAFSFLSLGIVFAFASSISWSLTQKWGAVVAPIAKVKSGPGQDNAVVFELHEGAPFVAKQKESNWYQIELSDGKIGWLASSDARIYFEL